MSLQTKSSIRQILNSAESTLTELPSPRLDAEVLLASSLKTERSYLYTHPEQQLTETELACFEKLLQQRAQLYPLAYLVGYREFWSLQLKVNQHTLIPRAETECLVEKALAVVEGKQGAHILDLGTGSGAIALALARQRPDVHILAVDVCDKALQMAKHNASQLQLRNVSFLQSDWFRSVKKNKYDLIVSNPPYVESGFDGFENSDICHEPRLALDAGQTGMDAINTIIPAARDYLKNTASIIIEHGSSQSPLVNEVFLSYGYKDVYCGRDYSGLERISSASWYAA